MPPPPGPTPAPEPKDTFLKACRALWDVTAEVHGLPELFLGINPEGRNYPRGEMVHEGEGPRVLGDYRTVPTAAGAPRPTQCEAFVTFRVLVENNSDAAEDLAMIVMNAFTPQAVLLTFDPNAVILRLPKGYIVEEAPFRSKAGNPVFIASIAYKAIFSTPY